jgi:16S rRNA (uracil1498-N3)-methyltransferase
MEKSIIKTPRLYTELDLGLQAHIELPKEQAHYLKNVMRKSDGDDIRLFNGRDGEWLCNIDDLQKKSARLLVQEQLRKQLRPERRIHAFFPPIKKQRMDFMIEKAVELGATDLHPVLTEHTEVRKINAERIKAQIIEAAEQCERLDIPVLYDLKDLQSCIQNCDFKVLAAIERIEAEPVKPYRDKDIGVLIGPEGGFHSGEVQFLREHKIVDCVSLGRHILRAETALLKFLCTI